MSGQYRTSKCDQTQRIGDKSEQVWLTCMLAGIQSFQNRI